MEFIVGDDAEKLNERVDAFEERLAEVHKKQQDYYFAIIDKLVHSSPVFLFIKVIER